MNQNNRKEIATKIVSYGNIYKNYLDPKTIKTVNDLTNLAQQAYLNNSIGSDETMITIQEIQNKYEEKVKKRKEAVARKLKIDHGTQNLAGYINASILIYFIALFGVLIALSIIIFQF